MTPLGEMLIRRIATTGPITIADYMSECLLHPRLGYYATRDPFGEAGDFTTAPEISQMFGELIGLCLAQAWLDQGRPRFTLAELGPGRGTLMADLLRAVRAVDGFVDAAELFLVEASPTLRKYQKARLATYQVRWVDQVDALPEAPLFLVANEFFDALPIRQFVRAESGWSERLVAASAQKLIFAQGAPMRLAGLEAHWNETPVNQIVETCGPAQSVVSEVGRRIASFGGAALFVDYGDWGSHGHTFQAVKAHRSVDPLAEPGETDLSAHVDFAALALGAGTAFATPLVPQGVFLERLGITARANTLAQNLTGKKRQTHIAAHRRLTHPEEMGTLFKVLGITRPGAPTLPGFDG